MSQRKIYMPTWGYYSSQEDGKKWELLKTLMLFIYPFLQGLEDFWVLHNKDGHQLFSVLQKQESESKIICLFCEIGCWQTYYKAIIQSSWNTTQLNSWSARVLFSKHNMPLHLVVYFSFPSTQLACHIKIKNSRNAKLFMTVYVFPNALFKCDRKH